VKPVVSVGDRERSTRKLVGTNQFVHGGIPSHNVVSSIPVTNLSECQLNSDHPTTESDTPQNTDNREIVQNILQDMHKCIADFVLPDPDQYIQPMREMLKTLQNIKSHNNMISAMHTFSKYSGGGKPFRRRIQCINVQSTAIQHLKRNIRGKGPGQSERLRKNVVAKNLDHSYAMPGRSPTCAPHNLSLCVAKILD